MGQGKGQEPTTKFKVDISELKQNLQAAQREIRLANAEFKAATAGMDKWSESADGISEKLTQLGKVESAQVKQLGYLKDQYELTCKELGENSKAAQELEIKIANQEAAIGKTRKEIRDFTEKLNDAEKESTELADAVEDASESAEKAEGGFTVLKGAIADLVADGIRAAIDSFKELLTAGDQAMGSFQAKTGASADEMARFSDEINELYKNNWGEDLQDVADSMATVAQNTKEVDPSKIKELTEDALTLRDTFDFEVNETMRAANMLMDQFGLTGDEAFSLIAQGAQNGLNKNDDLLDSINEYSVHYKQLGFTAEEFFNSLQNGTAAGTFSVDKLGDAMKEFGIRVKDGSDTTHDALDAIGLDWEAVENGISQGGDKAKEYFVDIVKYLFELEDPLERNTAGVALFGTMWEDLGEEGIKALADISGEADKTKEVMDDIKNAKYSDIGSQWSEIGRIIKVDFIQPLANEALPVVKSGLTFIKNNLSSIIPTITTVGATIATAFAVGKIMTFASTVKTAIVAFQGASTVIGGAKAAMAALNITMAANPIGLIVTAIAALVAAFVTLWNTSDTFRNFWLELWENIKTGFFAAMDAVTLFFTDTLPSVFNAVISFFQDNWQGILLLLVNPFAGAFKLLYDNFDGFRETVDEFILAVIDFFDQLPGAIYDIVVSIMGHVLAWGIQLIQFATTKVPEFINRVIDFISTLPGKVWTWLSETYNKLLIWGANMIQAGGEKASALIDAIINFVQTLPTKVSEWLTKTLTKLIEWGLKMVEKGKKAASDTVTDIINAFTDLPGKLYDIGANALQGFWNGLKEVGQRIKEWAEDFFEDILEEAEEVLDIASPSKAFKKIGRYAMEGFDIGLSDSAKAVLSNVRGTFENVKNTATNSLSGVAGNLRNSANNLLGLGGNMPKGNSTVVYNFNQTNNSPKSLSRLEIYRQSKNLLNRGRVHVQT